MNKEKYDIEFENILDQDDSLDYADFTDWYYSQKRIRDIPYIGKYNIPTILEPEKSIKEFFNSNKLRKKPNSINYKQHISYILNTEENKSIFFNAFWLIFLINFQPKNEKMMQVFRRKIKKEHLSLVIKVSKYKRKEEYFNTVEFVTAYLIHYEFFKRFPFDEETMIQPRFILNSYQIILYESRGFFVTDFFIQNWLMKIFTSDAFMYMNENIRVHQNVNQIENESNFYTVFNKTDESKKKKSDDKRSKKKLGNRSKISLLLFSRINGHFDRINKMQVTKDFDKMRYSLSKYKDFLANRYAQDVFEGKDMENKERDLLKILKPKGFASNQWKAYRRSSVIQDLKSSDKSSSAFVRSRKLKPKKDKKKIKKGIRKTHSVFHKRGAYTKLGFECTKLSPSVKLKLEASFKVNAKSSMKKKLQICMAEPDSKRMIKFKKHASNYSEKDIAAKIFAQKLKRRKKKKKKHLRKNVSMFGRNYKGIKGISNYEELIQYNNDMGTVETQNLWDYGMNEIYNHSRGWELELQVMIDWWISRKKINFFN